MHLQNVANELGFVGIQEACYKILSVYNNKTRSKVGLVGINTTYIYADICNICHEVGSGHLQNAQK